MELNKINDHDLNLKIKSLAVEERKLTNEILIHIAEVDKRRLFLRMAYPSLFEYLTKEIGYSAGAAHRRIDAARLMHKVPEISLKIEDGSLHLIQISKMQKICRHIKKESGKAVEISMQKDVLRKIENKTSEQTDLILAQEFQVEIKTSEKKLVQRDESVRIELTFTKEEMDLIIAAQSFLSNKTGGGLKDTLVELAGRLVKSYQPKIKSNPSKRNINVKSKDKATFTSTVEVKSVTPRLKKEIINRDQKCQFVDARTGKRCASNYFLEVDHIRPRYLRGSNNPQNLRLLCKNHNLFRYKEKLV